jgi:hypothetical protein
LRLEPGLRFWSYAAFATLLVTGVIWLIADTLKTSADEELWQAVGVNMLMLHGMAAMIALVLLGAVIALHVRYSWRAGKNRISGAVMVGANATLVATAWGLYYAGSDLLRTFVADVHIAVGIGLPALVATHVVLGRRTRKRAYPKRSRAEPLTGVVAGLVPATPKVLAHSKDSRGGRDKPGHDPGELRASS